MKTKSLLISLAVAVAAALPAPSAQASELAKLGRLIVTGKRAPAPEPKPALPPVLREAEPRGAVKGDGPSGRALEAGGEPSVDDAGAIGEPVSMPRPGSDALRGDRVGRGAVPVTVG